MREKGKGDLQFLFVPNWALAHSIAFAVPPAADSSPIDSESQTSILAKHETEGFITRRSKLKTHLIGLFARRKLLDVAFEILLSDHLMSTQFWTIRRLVLQLEVVRVRHRPKVDRHQCLVAENDYWNQAWQSDSSKLYGEMKSPRDLVPHRAEMMAEEAGVLATMHLYLDSFGLSPCLGALDDLGSDFVGEEE